MVNISAGLLSRIENLYGGTDGGILQSDPFSRILTESTNIVLKILTDPHRYLTDISRILTEYKYLLYNPCVNVIFIMLVQKMERICTW